MRGRLPPRSDLIVLATNAAWLRRIARPDSDVARASENRSWPVPVRAACGPEAYVGAQRPVSDRDRGQPTRANGLEMKGCLSESRAVRASCSGGR
jgi:hypothetical protein